MTVFLGDPWYSPSCSVDTESLEVGGIGFIMDQQTNSIQANSTKAQAEGRQSINSGEGKSITHLIICSSISGLLRKGHCCIYTGFLIVP